MLKSYAFADRMLSPDLRQALEHMLIDYFVSLRAVPLYGAVIFALAHLPSTSRLLQAMIDAHCRDFQEREDTEENGELQLHDQLPNAFLVGVMKRFAQMHADTVEELTEHDFCYEVKGLDRCDYHGHATKEERKDCKIAVGLAADDDSDSDSNSDSSSDSSDTDSSDSD